MAASICLMIVAAYLLNFLVKVGVYGPNHAASAAPSGAGDYGDGSSYAEPPPPGGILPPGASDAGATVTARRHFFRL